MLALHVHRGDPSFSHEPRLAVAVEAPRVYLSRRCAFFRHAHELATDADYDGHGRVVGICSYADHRKEVWYSIIVLGVFVAVSENDDRAATRWL